MSEKFLLQFDGLSIRTCEFLDLIVEVGNCLFNIITISQSGIELGVCLLNSKDLLINSFSERADSVIQLAVFTVENLQAEFLVLNFLLFSSLVSLELENPILLLLLNIVIVSDLLVKPLNIASQRLVVMANLFKIRGRPGDLNVALIN